MKSYFSIPFNEIKQGTVCTAWGYTAKTKDNDHSLPYYLFIAGGWGKLRFHSTIRPIQNDCDA